MDIDRLPIPNVGNNIFYKEFSIGAMLPQIGLSGKGVSPGHEYDGVGVITVSDNINIDEEDIDDDSLLKSFTEAKRTLVSVIEEKKRSQLPDSSFGIPEDRKYPLDTKKHVESAIRLFSHSEKSKKKELAKRIKAKADEYNIEIPETTQCYKYLQESAKNIFEPTCDEHKLFRKYMLYKKQLDSGKISKAEYDKKLKNDKIPINLFDRVLEKYKKAETRPEGKGKVIERRKVSDRQATVVVDKLEAEKVKRWYNICKTTDDYKEYKTYFNNICKFFKIPNTYVLGCVEVSSYKNERQVTLTFRKNCDDIDTSNKKLYHTSNVNNITRLNGSFRSKDGRFLFPEKRIYFGINNAVKRSADDKDEMAKYTYTPTSKINKISDAAEYDPGKEIAGFIRAEHLDVDKVKTEACKDVQTARKFVSEVGKLAKKYNANYFIVTDGASGIHNQGEPAVKFHRDKQIEWERKNGFDPDDDWRNNPDDMTGYKLQTESQFDASKLTDRTIITDNIQITKSYGIYDNRGKYNAIVDIKPNIRARGRSEILIVDGDKVYLSKSKIGLCGNYAIPGGGWDKNESHDKSAIREAEEEARLKSRNVKYVGCYLTLYDEPHPWVKNYVDEKYWWRGYYTEVYIGEFDRKYTGFIDDTDKDDLIKTGKFYQIKDVINELHPIHANALKKYL